jgi:hypothetical protein
MQPYQLPHELPIGTKMTVGETSYTALSNGQLRLNPMIHYWFKTVESTSGSYKGSGTFLPDRINWSVLPKIECNSIINCKWCNKVIDNGMTICSSHESKCELYWDALKNRMSLDFRKPEDALEYDRECIKKFIDKKENNV